MHAAKALRDEPDDRWLALADLALQGLRSTYGNGQDSLPHTMTWDGITARPARLNVRYALISLLGLGRSRSLGLKTTDLTRDLWTRVEGHRRAIENSAGDMGLALWAQAITTGEGAFTPTKALQVFRKQRASLDTVHLAWAMLGADHFLAIEHHDDAEELVRLTKGDLLRLFHPDANLFYRHAKNGLFAGVTRRVPCFANQIYPVMALAVHAQRTGDTEAADVGRRVAENLCRLQGPLGQWWWLYDAKEGVVVDGYPAFSVHQDGMAPMALLETEKAGGRSFDLEIEKGLSWIYGANELASNMILEDQALVLRDIHQKGVGRGRRAFRSAAWCSGFRRNAVRTKAVTFVINRECRPYHLGWILYAASLMKCSKTGQVWANQSLEGCGQCS
jgi:hypothetical protein